MYYGTHYDSPVGDILLAGDENHIIGLWIGNQKYITTTMPKNILPGEDTAILRQGIRWLDAYFAGKRPVPQDLPLAPAGSPFQKCVWRLLTEIPYGELATYGAIAEKAAKILGKNSMSAQAAGGAVGHNPISIIIPCHRVVGANGSLTGYAGGLDKKAALLMHEGVDMQKLFFPKS